MAFSYDLSAPGSAGAPLLAPKGDPSIAEGALVGQQVAVRMAAVALGGPGFSQGDKAGTMLTGVVQVFKNTAFNRDLLADTGQGSYPTGAEAAMAGLGRSLAFSKDGTELYAGDPSWDSDPTWTKQRGAVFKYGLADGSIREVIKGTDDAYYFGASVDVDAAPNGDDALYVSYFTSADAGRVDGYAISQTSGASKRSTFQPSDATGDAGFGSMGLLGGAVVANTYTGGDGNKYFKLLVTAEQSVYHFGTPAPMSLEKTTDPADGKLVYPGQKLTFTLTAENPNRSPLGTVLTDDLSKVLPFSQSGTVDDIEVSFDPVGAAAPAPVVDADGGQMTWTGQVPGASAAGPGKVKITYGITIKKSQESSYYAGTVDNAFVSDYSDDTPKTSNGLGKVDLTKRLLLVADDGEESPVSLDATLAYGQKYVYEIDVTNSVPSGAKASPVETTVTDDLGNVIDDAEVGIVSIKGDAPVGSVTWNDAGSRNKVVWKGTLDKGQTVTVRVPVTTYPADHTPAGDHLLKNSVLSDRGPDSTLLSNKVVDTLLGKAAFDQKNESISKVRPGKPILYKLTYKNSTEVTIHRASISDDLSGVIGYAGEPTDLTAESDRAGHQVPAPVYDADAKLLTWEDTSGIHPGETVTISYRMSVKPGARIGTTLVNTVSSKQSGQTARAEVEIAGMDPVSRLPLTGNNMLWLLLVPIIGLLMVLAGYSVYRRNGQG